MPTHGRPHPAQQFPPPSPQMESAEEPLNYEGYLIKRGGRVKTWKMRWFVLNMGTETVKTLREG